MNETFNERYTKKLKFEILKIDLSQWKCLNDIITFQAALGK